MDSLDQGNIDYLKEYQQQPVKYLVFSGGGAKGAAYPGAYSALNESGIFQNIEAIAGSSAGALSATFMATGIAPQKFQKLTEDTNLKSLLGKDGISWPIPLGKDATPMYKLLQKTVAENISGFFDKNQDITKIYETRVLEVANKQSALIKEQQEVAKKLYEISGYLTDQNINQQNEILENRLQNIKGNLAELKRQGVGLEKIAKNPGLVADLNERAMQGGKIYFKDLSALRALDPMTFKNLLITAVQKDTGQVQIFSPEQTPNVEIALAARASTSIPLVIKPVEIEGHKYVDGGYRDNIPLEHFGSNYDMAENITKDPKKIKYAQNNGRALVFAFGSGQDDKANVAIYSEKDISSISNFEDLAKFLLEIIYKTIAKVKGNFLTSIDEAKDYEQLRDNADSVVVIDTKDVGTLSFDKAQDKTKYLCTKSELTTLNHLNNWDLAKNPPTALNERSFLLKIYEEIDKKYPKISEKYLEFCTKDKWLNGNKNAILKDFIKLTDNDNHKSSGINDILLKQLNKPDTSDIIKKDFMKVYGIDNSHLQKRDLAKFQFKDKSSFSQGKTSASHAMAAAADAMRNITGGLIKVGKNNNLQPAKATPRSTIKHAAISA